MEGRRKSGPKPGFRHSLETKAKIARTMRARAQSPDARAALSARASAALENPETRTRVGAAARQRWADPQFRARSIAAMKAASARPETRARRSQAQLLRLEDPAYRAECMARLTPFKKKAGTSCGPEPARKRRRAPDWLPLDLHEEFAEMAAQTTRAIAEDHCRVVMRRSGVYNEGGSRERAP